MNKSINNKDRGVVYFVTGEARYLKECIFSAKSFKKYCPDIPITLFTDKKNINKSCFDEVVLIENDVNPFKNKVKYLYCSPYEYTLFLDSDTQVIKPIEELFDYLHENDLAIANMCEIDRTCKPAKLINYIRYDYYNTGVILYKKSTANDKFFEKWLEYTMSYSEEMISDGINDQSMFIRLIQEDYHKECNLKLIILSNKIYNVRPPMIQPLKQDGEMKNVKILHYHDQHLHPIIRESIKIWTSLKNDLRKGALLRRLVTTLTN